MATIPRPVPDGFEALTDTISIYRPVASNHMRSASLIVICSWMAALPKHITKYTDQYKKRFPSSTILVIQSYWQDVAASDEKMISRLALAVNTIIAHTPLENNLLPQTGGKDRVMLHSFSNGGATIANHLSIQLQQHRLQLEKQQPTRQLFSRVILECTPSRPNVSKSVKAISYALPKNFILRTIGVLFLRCYIFLGLLQCRVRGVENMVDRIRRRLNATSKASTSAQSQKDGQLWNPAVPRLYLYSKGDEVVGWQDVRDHAEEARREATFECVWEEVFETAPHVSLPREDFARYWGVVERWMSGEENTRT